MSAPVGVHAMNTPPPLHERFSSSRNRAAISDLAGGAMVMMSDDTMRAPGSHDLETAALDTAKADASALAWSQTEPEAYRQTTRPQIDQARAELNAVSK